MSQQRLIRTNRILSIIIPTHGRHLGKLEELLIELEGQVANMKNSVEIICVVNGLTENTRFSLPRKAKALRAKFLRYYEVLKPSIARNIGAKQAEGGSLLFLDADVSLPSDFAETVETYLDELSRGQTVALFPNHRPLTRFESFWQKSEYEEDVRSFNSYRVGGEIRILNGTFILIRREVFFQLHGFNEVLPASEDRELAARLLQMGGKILFAEELELVHKYPASLKNILRRKRWHASGNAFLYLVYPQLYQRRLLGWLRMNLTTFAAALLRLNLAACLYQAVVVNYYLVAFYYYKFKYLAMSYNQFRFREKHYLKKFARVNVYGEY